MLLRVRGVVTWSDLGVLWGPNILLRIRVDGVSFPCDAGIMQIEQMIVTTDTHMIEQWESNQIAHLHVCPLHCLN